MMAALIIRVPAEQRAPPVKLDITVQVELAEQAVLRVNGQILERLPCMIAMMLVTLVLLDIGMTRRIGVMVLRAILSNVFIVLRESIAQEMVIGIVALKGHTLVMELRAVLVVQRGRQPRILAPLPRLDV